MDFGTQDSRGPGLNKRMWSIDEDRKLIETLLDLQNEGKYKVESGFKPGLFNAVEKKLAETLPNSRLKADPHIKSRIKTLKAHFGIVHDMISGSHTSGFGFDDAKMCVVAEKEVWEAYLQSHKKAAYFRDKPFPLYKELCIIFGKDRATGKDAETPADALEELNKENAQIGDDCEVNDGLDSMSFTQSATIGMGMAIAFLLEFLLSTKQWNGIHIPFHSTLDSIPTSYSIPFPTIPTYQT